MLQYFRGTKYEFILTPYRLTFFLVFAHTTDQNSFFLLSHFNKHSQIKLINYEKNDRYYYEYYEWTDRYYEWTDEYYEWTEEYYEWKNEHCEWEKHSNIMNTNLSI